MITANRAYNDKTMRDFCFEMDALQVKKFQRTGGYTNEKYLIADTFLIMLANQFTDTYVYETMDLIKENKTMYKFAIKKAVNEISKWLDDYSKEYYGCMNRDSQGNVGDMGISLEKAFDGYMNSLHDATYNYVKANLKGDTEIITRILICIMLCDWCVTYMKSRLRESVKENPIITKVTWMSHEPLRKLVYKLDSLIGTPEKVNDIKIYAQFNKFQTKWCDAEFIADNLGEGQPSDYVDGSTCQMELRELFNHKTISKN